MASVLVDTSVWVEAFRGKEAKIKGRVDSLLDADRVVLCGVVELELIHGLRDKERREIIPLLDVLPFLEAERQDWRASGELLAVLRSRGKSIPATDGLIATLCLRHQLTLFTLDKHFEGIPNLRLLRSDS
jgi:predicted nucleic acid-binding protein